MRRSTTKFALIGPGKVGSSVASALVRAGWFCTAIVYKHRASGGLRILRSQFPNTKLIGSPGRLAPDFQVLLIAVRDDEIRAVIPELASLAHIDWTGRTALHFSGVVEVATLSELQKLGASVGAFHPISPFATRFSPEHAERTYYDFFGTSGAMKIGRTIARTLDSKIIVLHSERERVTLHLASVLASNSIVIAVRSAERIISDFMKPADSRAVLYKLLGLTSDNISRNTGFKALTGPLVRGDLSVIAKHVEVLKTNKRLLQFYRSSQLLGIDALLEQESDTSRRTRLKRIKKLLEE